MDGGLIMDRGTIYDLLELILADLEYARWPLWARCLAGVRYTSRWLRQFNPRPRAKRNVDNMRENLWFFAPGILIAAIIGMSNQWTILGAQIFFFARVLHAITYLTGWPYIRPLFWFAGIIGCALVYLALFGILV